LIPIYFIIRQIQKQNFGYEIDSGSIAIVLQSLQV